MNSSIPEYDVLALSNRLTITACNDLALIVFEHPG